MSTIYVLTECVDYGEYEVRAAFASVEAAKAYAGEGVGWSEHNGCWFSNFWDIQVVEFHGEEAA